MKIWIRVGMEADVTADELKEIKNGNKKLMWEIIQNAEVCGETYVPYCDPNEDVYEDDDDYIEFEF